jgi:hypothetical protein
MQSLLSPFLSSSKNACESKPGAAIVLSTCLMVMASNPLEHSATGAADATPVDPMASPSKMAEMATPVLRTAILPIGWLQIRNPLPARHGLSTPTRLSRCWRNGGAASQGFTAIPASASSGIQVRPKRPWHEVLGVVRDAPREVIEAAGKAMQRRRIRTLVEVPRTFRGAGGHCGSAELESSHGEVANIGRVSPSPAASPSVPA